MLTFTVLDNEVRATDEDGLLLAHVTFPLTEDGTLNINHTFVDDSLRGQGVASQLLLQAAEHIRQKGLHTHATCSYATTWFNKHPGYDDIYIR